MGELEGTRHSFNIWSCPSVEGREEVHAISFSYVFCCCYCCCLFPKNGFPFLQTSSFQYLHVFVSPMMGKYPYFETFRRTPLVAPIFRFCLVPKNYANSGAVGFQVAVILRPDWRISFEVFVSKRPRALNRICCPSFPTTMPKI